MRLFTRTLLFFISVIVFQAALSVFLVDRIVSRDNREDARKQLREEASAVYDSFNSWKRGIWKNLIRISGDREIASAFDADGSYAHPARVQERLRRIFLTSGVDYVVVKAPEQGRVEYIPVSSLTTDYPDAQLLRHRSDHPTIRVTVAGGRIFLNGSLHLPSAAGGLDIFVVKEVNQNFLSRLSLYSQASVSLLLGTSETIVGTFPAEKVSLLMKGRGMDTAYREYYDVVLERESFNGAVQKIGPVEGDPGNRDLYLLTMISAAPYVRRVLLIGRTVVSVTLLTALLAILLGLFFSRNISLPVRKLLAAMRNVQMGAYDTVVPVRSGDEFGQLLEGFNEMAATIHMDKQTMESYIGEITLLTEYNERIIHSLRAGIGIINSSFILEKVNRSFLQIFSLTEENVVGKDIALAGIEVLDDSFREKLNEVFSGQADSFAVTKRSRGKRVYELKLYPLHGAESGGNGVTACILTVDDISSKVELEEKIFQAEKLSSISMLSAGVAHEINNPLSSIMTNVQNLIAEEEDPEKSVSLRWIEQETRRIASIVRELLDFSSRDSEAAPACDVNDVAENILLLVSYSIKKTQSVILCTDFSPDLPPAGIGSDELKQVMVNLIKNSIQAVGQSGRILIRTTPGEEGKTIRIRIEDNGQGIREEIIPHIFDPFFTTKKNGEGTGLGLSVVYGILNKYHGTIDVKSREGEYTVFTLEIPAHRQDGVDQHENSAGIEHTGHR